MHKLEGLNNGLSERSVTAEEVMPVAKVGEEVEGLGRTLNICQLGSASMLKLGLQVQGKLTMVFVVAEVTIVSDKVLRSCDLRPEITRNRQMHATGGGMSMKAFVTSLLI